MKKLLFVLSDFYPYRGACANVLKKLLIDGKLEEVFSVDILAPELNKDSSDPFSVGNHNVFTYRIDSKKGSNPVKNDYKGFLKINYYFHKIFKKINDKFHKSSFYNNVSAQEVYKALVNLHAEKYDLIISILGGKYYETAAVTQFAKKKSVKYAVYQMDPCMYNRGEKEETFKERHLFEKDVYKNAEFILTTDVIRKEHESDDLKEYLSKVHTLEFALIVPKTYNFTANEKKKCVFCGSIYRRIRNPDYAIKLFSGLLKDDLIELIFLGANDSFLNEEQKKLGIKCLGKQPFEKCVEIMADADILINIGNTVDNQVPSKIFDYISMGKPIVNVRKIDNCPTLPYLSKYPYTLDLVEDENILEEQHEKLRGFIKKSSEMRQLSPETIKELFKECTPEYCAAYIHSVIDNVLK